ncbi:hypothetical protein ACFQ9X_35435 [Catenulispora yoronensis]
MDYADPEQCFAFAARVAERLVEPRCSLEQFQLLLVLDPVFEESGVDQAAAGEGMVGLDGVKALMRGCQGIAVATENCLLIKVFSQFNTRIRSHFASLDD